MVPAERPTWPPLAALFALCCLASSLAPQERPPNIVLFYTDDMGYSDLGCYGCKDIATPNIDALARAGVRMTHFYTSAPICAPSRASLLTGLSPQAAGVGTNFRGGPNIVGMRGSKFTIAELLKARGYATAVFGKWHLGTATESLPQAQGFDEFFGHRGGCVEFFSHMFVWHRTLPPFHDLWRNDREVHEDGKYMTHLITREALRFIGEKKDRPFFLYVPYNAPHYPLEAPGKWLDKYRHLGVNRGPYAAMIGCLDDSVGRIVASIRHHGLLDNTLFIFTNDNGPSNEGRTKIKRGPKPGSSAPFRGEKFSVYEGGIRSPFIAAWPGRIKAGTVSREPGILTDLFPTIAKAAGAKAPAGIEGRSLWPVFRGGKSPHDALAWEFNRGRAVRRDHWKLVVPRPRKKGEEVPPELYDLRRDPGEKTDLAKTNPALVRELLAIHARWRDGWRRKRRNRS